MNGKGRFEKSFFVMIALIVVLCGCATDKGHQVASSDYKNMMTLQQQKASAIKAEEPPLPAGYEATAETHEQLGDAYIRSAQNDVQVQDRHAFSRPGVIRRSTCRV